MDKGIEVDKRYYDLLEENLREIKHDLKDIKKDIDGLNGFKWKVTGIASFLSTCLVAFIEVMRRMF